MASTMKGTIEAYYKMYDTIKNWDKYVDDSTPDYILSVGYILMDAPFHGWEGEGFRHERDVFHKVEDTYDAFKQALEEALGDNANLSNEEFTRIFES